MSECVSAWVSEWECVCERERERKRKRDWKCEKSFELRLMLRGCANMKKKQRPEPMCTTIFNFFVLVFCWMKIDRKAKTKESIYMNKRGREKKDHRRDGLPAEGYEGAGQGHIFPWHHVRWWLTPGLPRKGDNTFEYDMMKKKRGIVKNDKNYTYLRKTHINTHNWEKYVVSYSAS